MESASEKKSGIANSILAKFQQVSKQKEDAKIKQGPNKTLDLNKRKRKPGDEILHTGMSEKDVGIIQYISKHAGFQGIIKHRFTDFQVHEIDPEGNIVELTSTGVESVPVAPVEVSEETKAVLSKEYWDQIESVLTDPDNKVVKIDVNDKDKSERSLIHKAIKSVYGTRVYSNTVTEDEKTIIQVGKAANNERLRWPEDLPHFLHFTVSKKNIDTTHFIYLLSKKIRLKPNHFTYAGTKDRRAVTTQRMCVKRKRAEDVAKQTLWGVKIGNYEYKQKPLRLGDLSGNKFTVTIRSVTAEDSVINEAFENLKETGFINYFGLQRFGSSVVAPTFHIGKALLKRDWKLAVELILKPRPDEKAAPWVKSAREAWWNSRESGPALRLLSRHQNSIEFRVLKHLKTTPNDFSGALKTIPRNTLLLYLHSYQSYIWNNIVSRRIDRFQMSPQVGDLVIVSKDSVPEEMIIDDAPSGKAAEEGGEKEDEEEAEEDSTESAVEEVRRGVVVSALTEDDVKSTSIYDIVYPLPGYDVEYPKNEIAEWYHELLSVDSISQEDFKSNDKLFCLYGAYRKPFLSIQDLSWKIVKHKNFDDDLVLSDIDKLEKNTLPEQPEDGEHKSVVADMTLKPSSYCTMALREVMKADTSTSFHASLTNAAQAEKKLKISDNGSETSDLSNGDKA